MNLAEALAALNDEEVSKMVKEKIDSGVDALSIIDELREGMDVVGDRFKKGEYFLSELIVSGEIFKEAMKDIEPLLKAGSNKPGIKMVLGTVKGDIHNIGKDIVGVLLKAAGFDVYDLGIDVPPSVFVDKLVETEAPILGLSALLTTAFTSMKETVEAVDAAGLREKVRIIVGGGIVTEQVREFTGADAFATDAIDGVNICKDFAKK